MLTNEGQTGPEGFSMRYGYSAHLCQDVNLQVRAAARYKGMVNVTAVAEAVRLRNLAENVALEDIECLVLQAAQFCGAAMEFDSLTVLESHNVHRHSVNCDGFDVLQDRTVSLYHRQPDRTQ
ncbi:MAG: hypothetical protein EOR30_26870 [Mesorhizobium sp.]|uniref:hypothetical protein n=1 Tax=unclassified Mesorhizobium TaxID=325217 RepID=UPI000FCB7612|nr:hypothetical protein EOA78_02455 [Mesorhizobium sp. M5C.F.Cr.IN.023.01.1.1]RWF90579.1 MAG: hypothetical protein EOQ36_00635 [Mesorhizobium sp.]RWF96721.1 MAG: hypothetical protein EOQ45_01775 [Mesorhizobium sp.]RWI41647.1 MAG: hypothetical protein EOR14_06625 [Mesorhizobium sp.]RWI50831.1 MAG: hypothetical protein EOR15_05265 [Mesorhizobium sp.]